MDTIIFRTTYLALTLGNVLILYMGVITQNIFIELIPFTTFLMLIITGLNSFSYSFAIRMSQKEDYVYNLFNYSFSPEFRFLIMIICGLAFSYVGYDIYAFLIIMAGAGDATLQKNISKILTEE